MKKLAIAITICLISITSFAQNVDYNSIILPSSATDISFEEKLVRLAWKNNPENNILSREINIANYEKKIEQWDWLDQIKVAGNLNEFNIDTPTNPDGTRIPTFSSQGITSVLFSPLETL